MSWKYLLPAAAMLTACQPAPLEIELDTYQPQMVVSSEVSPGMPMVVSVTKSISALTFDPDEDTMTAALLSQILVSNAFVSVTCQGITSRLYESSPGIYVSQDMPQYVNSSYELLVYEPISADELRASAVLLPQVPFDVVYPVVLKTASDTTVSVTYGFTDLEGDNWYMAAFYKKEQTGTGFDLCSHFPMGTNRLVHINIISDKTLSSNKYSGTSELPSEVGAADSLAVVLSNISEAYYNFLSLRSRSDNWFSEITKEPISYPTNVTGGLGFFSPHYPSVAKFDLRNY